MLIIGPYEICPHSKKCQYADTGVNICRGCDPERSNNFTCDLYQNNGSILSNKFRSSLDTTGTMKIIHE